MRGVNRAHGPDPSPRARGSALGPARISAHIWRLSLTASSSFKYEASFVFAFAAFIMRPATEFHGFVVA